MFKDKKLTTLIKYLEYCQGDDTLVLSTPEKAHEFALIIKAAHPKLIVGVNDCTIWIKLDKKLIDC